MAIIFNEYDLVNHDDRLVEDQVYQESVIAGILIGGGIIAAVATIIAIVSKHLKKSAAGNPEKKNDDSSAEGLSIDKPEEVRKRLEEVRTKLEAIGGTVTIPDGFIDFNEFNTRLKNYTDFAEQARAVLDTEGQDLLNKLEELNKMISNMSNDNKYIRSGPNNQVNNTYLDQIIECSAKVQDVTKTYAEVAKDLNERGKTLKEKAEKETDNAERDRANDISEKIKKLSADATKIGENANNDMSKFRALIDSIIKTVNSKSNTQTKDNGQQKPTNSNNPPVNNGNGNNNEPPGISTHINDFVDNNVRNKSGEYVMNRDEVSGLMTKIYDRAVNKSQEGIKDIVNAYIKSHNNADELTVFRNLLKYIDDNNIIHFNDITIDLIPTFGAEIENKIKSLSDKVEYIVQNTKHDQFDQHVSQVIQKEYKEFVNTIVNALGHTNEEYAKNGFIQVTNDYIENVQNTPGLFSKEIRTNPDGSTTEYYVAKDNFVDTFVRSCEEIIKVMQNRSDLYGNVPNIDFDSEDNSYIKRDPKNKDNWICTIDGHTNPASPPSPKPEPPNQEVENFVNRIIDQANKTKQPFSKLKKDEMVELIDNAVKLKSDSNKLESYLDKIITDAGTDKASLSDIYKIFTSVNNSQFFKNDSIVASKLTEMYKQLKHIDTLSFISKSNINETKIFKNANNAISARTKDQQDEAKQLMGNPKDIIEKIVSEIDQKDFDTAANILIDEYKKYMGECIKNGVFKYDPVGKMVTIDDNKRASFDMVLAIFDGIATDCGVDNNGVKMTDKLAGASSPFTTNKVTKDLYDECLTLAGHNTNLSPEDQMLSNIDFATFTADARSKKYSVNISEQEWYTLAKDIFNASLNSHDANDFNTYIISKANDKLSDKNYLQTLRDLTVIISKDKNFPTNTIPQSEINNIEQKINGMVQSHLSVNTQAAQIAKNFISNGMDTFNGYSDTNQTCTMKQNKIQTVVYEIIQSITQDVAQLGSYIANTCKTLKNSAKRSDQGKLIIFKRLISETLNAIGTDKKVINTMVGIVIDEIPDNLKDIASESMAAANNSQHKHAISQLEQLLSTKYSEICNNVINDCNSNNIDNIIQTYKAYLGAFMNANYFVQDASGYYKYDLMHTDMFEILKNSLYTTVECFNNVSINTIDLTEFKNVFGDGFTGPYSADQYNEFIQLAGNKYGHKQINKAFTIEKFIEDDFTSHLDPRSGVRATGTVTFDDPNKSRALDLLQLQQDYDINEFFKINFNNYDALNTSDFITEFARISNLARYITLMGLYDRNSGIIPLSRESIYPILRFYPTTGKEISKIDIKTDINTYRANKTALKNGIQSAINNVINICERKGVFKGGIFNNTADKKKEAHRKKMENFVTNALDAMDKVKQYYDYIMNKGNNP